MIPISNSEDDDGPSHVPIPAPGLPPPLAGEAWASWLVLSSAFLLAGKGQAQHAPPSPEAPPVDSPPRPRRLEGQHLHLCAPGARSKAGEELPSA
jgi:hypothetical protein